MPCFTVPTHLAMTACGRSRRSADLKLWLWFTIETRPNREKKIDTTIVRDITKDSYERMKPGNDEFTLVAGDSDYVPIVEDLVERAFKFDVAFWHHASRVQTCSKFISLNKYLEHLRLHPSASAGKGK